MFRISKIQFFESNSQHVLIFIKNQLCCSEYQRYNFLKAIHNLRLARRHLRAIYEWADRVQAGSALGIRNWNGQTESNPALRYLETRDSEKKAEELTKAGFNHPAFSVSILVVLEVILEGGFILFLILFPCINIASDLSLYYFIVNYIFV